MQFYLAPMEGLTGYVYRSAYHKYFPAADRYFTPFITNTINEQIQNIAQKKDTLCRRMYN